MERLFTDEGELALVLEVRGRIDGEEAQRTVGVVYGDDWYTEIAGLARSPDHFGLFSRTVRTLTRSDRLLLGAPRRRRFVYQPPAGWHGWSPLPQFATWFPPDFPRRFLSITVYPAIPVADSIDVDLARVPFGPPRPADIIEEHGEPVDVARGGLHGRRWAFFARGPDRAEPFIRVVAMLASACYQYLVHVDVESVRIDEGMSRLDVLLSTVEPIPAATVRRDAAVDPFLHWV